MAANVGRFSNFEIIAWMHKASMAPCGTEDAMHAPTTNSNGSFGEKTVAVQCRAEAPDKASHAWKPRICRTV